MYKLEIFGVVLFQVLCIFNTFNKDESISASINRALEVQQGQFQTN